MTVKGIIIKENIVGEGDKYITLFTHELGQIQISALKSTNYKFCSVTQLFVYGIFEISKIYSRYKLINVEIITTFYKIREDILTLSYAMYIMDFLLEVTKESLRQSDLFQLTLYTLHELTKSNPSLKLIRCIYELRAMRCLGFMPNTQDCTQCGNAIGELDMTKKYYFSIADGGYTCCSSSKHRLRYDTLHTIRHILNSDYNHLYKFELLPEIYNELASFVIQYTVYHIEKSFRTLSFIREIERILLI
ncbi:MAG: DNA repair protein RecO [Epulopiscium sp. Nele67-Bin001]|nr:MAG: DNA repair protein RecO [Epulopiscium sp. Nele67-Bin001]